MQVARLSQNRVGIGGQCVDDLIARPESPRGSDLAEVLVEQPVQRRRVPSRFGSEQEHFESLDLVGIFALHPNTIAIPFEPDRMESVLDYMESNLYIAGMAERNKTEQQTGSQYLREFLPAVLGYSVALLLVILAVDFDSAGWWKYPVALVPVAPAIWGTVAITRHAAASTRCSDLSCSKASLSASEWP